MREPHELARLLPPMTADDYERLRADVAANGLLEPITLHEGKVLDGIHRERACAETKVKPRYEQFAGDDPAMFVFSKNIARRHLTVGQLAIVGAELALRLRARENSPRPSGRTAERVGDMLGISDNSITRAARVKKERPDLAKKVKAGKKTLNAAYEETTGRPSGGHGPRRSKGWNGKTNPTRERELRAEKKDNYNELLRLSVDMNRACSIIESYRVEEFALDAATLDLVDTFHDDLITLAAWADRALMATQGWLSTVKVRNKIAALRVTAGRTPEEAANFHRLADKLERKLDLALPVGA